MCEAFLSRESNTCTLTPFHTYAYTHTHAHIHTAEAVEQGITINSLEWLGSIYKHVEMLFTMSDWMDYTSTQTSKGNTPNILTVYTRRGSEERERERERGLITPKVSEWHVLQSEINNQ